MRLKQCIASVCPKKDIQKEKEYYNVKLHVFAFKKVEKKKKLTVTWFVNIKPPNF